MDEYLDVCIARSVLFSAFFSLKEIHACMHVCVTGLGRYIGRITEWSIPTLPLSVCCAKTRRCEFSVPGVPFRYRSCVLSGR